MNSPAHRVGKRERLSGWAAALGVTSLLERLARRPCLLGLNYHRVGDPDANGYDPALMEATPEEFDQQVAFLKKRFHLVELAEAQELAAKPGLLRHPHVLITFDDGYRDNHDVALPILRAHGARAAFFLATGFVGTSRVPWWDQVGFMLRRTQRNTIQLSYPHPVMFDLRASPAERVIRDVLRLYKHRETTNPERLLADVEAACEVPRPLEAAADRLFMSWDEARAMLAAGMGIGSHTHRHELLAKLTPEEQLEECRRSREVLQQQLGITVDALSYPVGSREAFSDVTQRCLREAGYRTAFSYYGGVNTPPTVDQYDVARIAVDRSTLPHYRLRVDLAAVTGRQVW
jgi:peptidoglycan/xylan/chitin deacetylase (PgdA/CDA1 family)